MSVLEILVVDDDAEYLKGLEEALPDKISDLEVVWTYEPTFEGAVQILGRRRFDLTIADVYLGDAPKGEIETGTVAVVPIIEAIQSARFCPLVTFSSGSRPPEIVDSAFLRFVQKGSDVGELIATIESIVATGIPKAARAMHDEIDRASSAYLWKFLVDEWAGLQPQFEQHEGLLERLLRKRTSIALSRIGQDNEELSKIEGVEYYLYPPISGHALRLGDVLRDKSTGTIRVVLTPHCHLEIQPGDDLPRADYVVTAEAVPAKPLLDRLRPKNGAWTNPWNGNNEAENLDKLRRRVSVPATQLTKPEGRLWFLPGFLEIPDSYVDFMRIVSIGYADIEGNFDRLATLDSPLAESLQASFSGFFASVGTPVLTTERYKHLMEWAQPEEPPA